MQSRIKTLEKLDRIEMPTQRELVARFNYPEPRRSARDVIEMERVTLGYDDVPLLRDIDLVVERGQKLGVIGPNGAGKTTLLKLVLGQLAAMNGTWRLGTNVDIATFAQHQVDSLDFSRTTLQELQTAAVRGEKRNMRSVLGSFGFPGDMSDRRVGDLSGGERTRLALAKALLNPVNLLILDEPTNHLDLASCDLLEDALRAYPGTILLVSHDRYLIREVCDGLVAVRNGTVRMYAGVDEAVLSPRSGAATGPAARAAARPTAPATRAPSGPAKKGSPPAGSAATGGAGAVAAVAGGSTARPAAHGDRGAQKRNEAEQRNARHSATKELRKQVDKLERDLGRAESEVADLQRQLADPGVYADNDQVQDLVRRHDEAKDKARGLMDSWMAASEDLERAARRSG